MIRQERSQAGPISPRPVAPEQGENSGELSHIDDSAGKHRVSPAQAAHIVQLKQINPDVTQAQIAAAVGVDQSTVSRWLAAFNHSTKDAAIELYDASQLQIAATVVDKALNSTDERIQLKAAEIAHKASKVLGDEVGTSAKVGIQVIIGMPGAPAGPDPFDRLQVVDSKGSEAQ